MDELLVMEKNRKKVVVSSDVQPFTWILIKPEGRNTIIHYSLNLTSLSRLSCSGNVEYCLTEFLLVFRSKKYSHTFLENTIKIDL